MNKVLIADSHVLFREGLQSLLTREAGFIIVGHAACEREVVETAQFVAPDLVLLDLDLPPAGGLCALQALLALREDLAVVILTAREHDDGLGDAIRLGAQGYLSKSIPFASLVAALHGVVRGELALTRAAMRQLLEAYRSEGQGYALAAESLSALTTREVEVLRLLLAGLSNRAIAEDLVISEHTVKVHVHRLLDKLHVDNRAQAARLARMARLDATLVRPDRRPVPD
jgi:two-component system nitrate/nitrite response regulator NarL